MGAATGLGTDGELRMDGQDLCKEGRGKTMEDDVGGRDKSNVGYTTNATEQGGDKVGMREDSPQKLG